MELLRDSVFEAGFVSTLLRPPSPTLTVVLKATLSLKEDGGLQLAEKQAPVTGDVWRDDDPQGPLRYESDFGAVKPCGEVTLVGAFHAPRGVPCRHGAVSLELGGVRRALAVFGPRRWEGALVAEMSDAEPVSRVDLSWENAYGGPGFGDNPHGKGRAQQTDGSVPLPLVEDPTRLLDAPDSRSAPMSFAPLSRLAPVRMARAGTFDPQWTASRWPWLPEDHDPHYHLASHPLQWCDGYWQGDEPFVLKNLVKGQERVSGRLPGMRARGLLARHDGAVETLQFRLDTVHFDTDAMTVTLLWRATTDTADTAMRDVAWVFLSHDEAGREGLPLMARYEALRAQQTAELAAFESEPVPTEEAAPEAPEGASEAPPEAPSEALAEIDAAMAAMPAAANDAAGPEALKAACEAAGIAEAPEVPVEAPEAEPEVDLRAQVLAALARGEALDGLDLTEADLEGLDLSGVSARATILTRARLDGARLCGADFEGATLFEASLRGVDATGARLVAVDATGAVFDAATMVKVFARQGCFERASLRGVDLTESDLREALFLDARLDEAKLVGCVADKADFARAVMTAVAAQGASLVKATLEQVSAERIDLRDAALERVRGSLGACFVGADFRNVRAPHALFGEGDFRGASLAWGEFLRADFSGANLAEAVLDACALKKARFTEANLTRCLMRHADAMEASFEGAQLIAADLRASNCYGANFYRARTDAMSLDGALLGATLLEAR